MAQPVKAAAPPCRHPLVGLLQASTAPFIGNSAADSSELTKKRKESAPFVGVLDLRRGNGHGAYIRGALRIATGMQGLEHRYSWLPPPRRKTTTTTKGCEQPTRRLIVLCDEEERAWAERKLGWAWHIAGFVSHDGDDDAYTSFWLAARLADLVEEEEDEQERSPAALLFEPSAMAKLVVALTIPTTQQTRDRPTTLLDLGCGAGRDMAWIVRQGVDQKSSPPSSGGIIWRVTGIDNVHSIVRRARLLATEMRIDASQATSSSCSAIEAVLWARATADGTLEALPIDGDEKKCASTFNDDVCKRLSTFAKHYLPRPTYDILLLVRFWPLALLPVLPTLTHTGSIIAISHFTTVVHSDVLHDAADIEMIYTSPALDKRFLATHVQDLIDSWQRCYTTTRWYVIHHSVQPCEDGRPLRNLIVRRDA